MSVLEDAARAYVAARLKNDAAEPRDWSHCAAELERTWRDLVAAFEGESLTGTEQ